jgi:hypothetical protein
VVADGSTAAVSWTTRAAEGADGSTAAVSWTTPASEGAEADAPLWSPLAAAAAVLPWNSAESISLMVAEGMVWGGVWCVRRMVVVFVAERRCLALYL